MKLLHLVTAAILVALPLAAQKLNPCQFTSIAPTCGPTYTGLDRILMSPGASYHVFTLTVSGAPQNALGFLAISMKQTRFPWPGSKCFVLVDPSAIALIPYQVDSTGKVRAQFTVKGKLAGTIFTQFAFNDAGSPKTTNANQITCK